MSFTVSIQDLSNNKFQLEVKSEMTVDEVKAKCETDLNLGKATSMRVIHAGKILQGDATLATAGVKADDFLVVMTARRKKKKRAAAPAPAPAPATPVPAPTPAVAPSTPISSSSTSTSSSPSVPTPAEAPSPTTVPTTPAPSTAQTTPAAPTAPTAPASSDLVTGSAYQDTVAQLMGLGFSNEEVVTALRAAFNNPERAAEYLFTGIPPQVLATMQQQQGQGQGQPQTPQAPQQAPQTATPQQQSQGEAPMSMGEGMPEGMPSPEQANAIRQMMQQNPEMMAGILQEVAQNNPQLAQMMQNPQAVAQLLQMMQQGGMPGMPGMGGPQGEGQAPPEGMRTIQVTPEERQSIENLQNLGFTRQQAIEAFFACDKNESLAANYLFDNM